MQNVMKVREGRGGGGWKVDDFEAFGMLFKKRC